MLEFVYVVTRPRVQVYLRRETHESQIPKLKVVPAGYIFPLYPKHKQDYISPSAETTNPRHMREYKLKCFVGTPLVRPSCTFHLPNAKRCPSRMSSLEQIYSILPTQPNEPSVLTLQSLYQLICASFIVLHDVDQVVHPSFMILRRLGKVLHCPLMFGFQGIILRAPKTQLLVVLGLHVSEYLLILLFHPGHLVLELGRRLALGISTIGDPPALAC